MNSRMLKTLKYAAAYHLLICTVFITSVPVAQAEALFLFRSPDATVTDGAGTSRSIQQTPLLKLDEKGDLMIQCGNARFTIAYNSPADQFKPPGQQYSPQREYSAPVSGVSLTASLSF
jgi:hypothetical protein